MSKIDKLIKYLERHTQMNQISDWHKGCVSSQNYIIDHLKKSKSIYFTHDEIIKYKNHIKKSDKRIAYKNTVLAGNWYGLCEFDKIFKNWRKNETE